VPAVALAVLVSSPSFLDGQAVPADLKPVYSVAYDVRDILAKPEAMLLYPKWNAFRANERRRQSDPILKAEHMVQSIVSMIGLPRGNDTPSREPIQVLNGTHLVVRANAEKHAEVKALLNAWRRFGDLWVVAKATLYEVDDAVYARVKSAKRLSREELDAEEERLVNGLPSKHEDLGKLLKVQKLVVASDDVKAESGFETTLLSKHHAVSCLPGPEQIRKGQKDRQTMLEGISFVGGIHVSPDRRYVRIKLTQKATEVEAVEKTKLLIDNEGNETVAETPMIKEVVHTETRDFPDGGTIVLPVEYRPRELRDKNRWWVLTITPRIVIPEEEEQVQHGRLEATLPLIVADILKNPRLKSTREFYGSAGDNRFALINSPAWTWPKELKLDTPGYKVMAPGKTGNRLLGIRVERANDEITVSLVNAGGTGNGAVVGSGMIRYTTHETEKGWTVRLAE
jgi:hypothetical protein